MVSSTEIPNAILNTSKVDGFIGIPVNPMMPAVNNNGIKFGINDTRTIRHERNKIAIKIPINTTAIANEINRLVTRYWVPFDATTEVPVKVTLHSFKSMAAAKLSLKPASS